jgi:hypothetical protein
LAHQKPNDLILLSLAKGASIVSAARQAGVSERTVRRRLSDAGFRTRISELRSEMVQAAVGRLAGLGKRAANELGRLLRAPKDQTRFAAAKEIMKLMLAGHQNEIIAVEVAELEKQIQELKAAAAAERLRPYARHTQAPVPSDNGESEPDADPPRLFFAPEEPFSGA